MCTRDYPGAHDPGEIGPSAIRRPGNGQRHPGQEMIGLWQARRLGVEGHCWTMIGIFFGSLVIAGIFMFVPGRIMYSVAFGQ